MCAFICLTELGLGCLWLYTLLAAFSLISSWEHFPMGLSQYPSRKQMASLAGIFIVKRLLTKVGTRRREPTEDSKAS